MTVLKASLIALCLLFAAAAHAGPRPRTVFAIIVTNNHASELGRPDLRYADDDGAKYYEVFRMLAPADHVHLLTDFDRDTRGLFPALVDVARSPTKANVVEAAADVARGARAALAAGDNVEVYFVFAGHGDVDRGAGFLELADGSFGAQELDKHVLSGIPATHTHVILDSCNSFFVISARKPGGHRFATPNDLAETFAKKLPHVGVFLSTSAEQEVFEWSELQSGIFSHAVRSGLLGAADADGDGSISYRELQAFVTVAAAQVKNPLYRPHVFARGPAGKNEAALVDLGGVDAVKVSVGPDETRLTVRDKEALPWIDAHTERGSTVVLRIPAHAGDGTIERLDGGVIGDRRQLIAGPAAPVALSSLAAADGVLAAARGPDLMLRSLFAQPFGPRAVAQLVIEPPGEQVFGIAQDDAARMDLLLGAVADTQRQQRLLASFGAIALGAIYGGLGAAIYVDDPHSAGGIAALLGGAGLAIVGAASLGIRSDGEKLHDDFRQRMMRRHGDDVLIVADTERRLAELAARNARGRHIAETMGWALGGAGLVAAALGAIGVSDVPVRNDALIGTGGVLVLAGGLVIGAARLSVTPEERLWGLWRDDPGLRRLPRFAIAPTQGGAVVGLNAQW